MGIIIKWAELSKGYYYGEFLQHKPGLGCEVTGDTTEDEALDTLEKMLDKWHTKKTSGTPFEALKPETVSYSGIRTIAHNSPTSFPESIPIISKDEGQPEDTLTAIQSAKTLEELQSYKLLTNGNKTLYDAYCQRLKELA